MTQALTSVRIALAHPTQLYVGGLWVEARMGGRIEVISPNTEDVIATVAEAGEADIDAAVAAAREAFDRGPWPRLDPAERADWLRKLSAAL
ncbi:MAG TPA: aldehyde dehydrogenase family protein, partial [Ramlibacter sp.]|nr:aldehyde dehydrogenase family protein [Ramlibacter sp.]